MKYIPRGNTPSLACNNELSQVMADLVHFEDDNPAMESLFSRRATGGSPTPLKFKIELKDLNSGSIRLLLKALENFTSSLSTYSRNLSDHFNKCVGAMFTANKNAMKLAAARIDAAKKEKAKLEKEITTAKAAHKDTAEMENQVLVLDEKLDQYTRMIYSLKDGILITKDVANAIQQCDSNASNGFKMLGDLYNQYLDLLASQIKPESLLYGKVDAEKYAAELSKLVESIRMGGSFNRSINKIETSMRNICESQIYGAQSLKEDEPMVEYSLDTVKHIIKRYEWFREIITKMTKRAADLRSMLLAIQGGKTTPFSVGDIVLELVFLVHFSMELSTMMELYLDPHMGICKAEH